MRRLLRSRRWPSPGTLLGGIALFVALSGTALAATGQLVNIADGTTAANVAKVDSTGALRTSQANLPTPAKVFSTYGYASSGDATGYSSVVAASTSTVALSRIVIENDLYGQKAREVRLFSITVPAGSACSTSSAYSDARSLGRYLLGPTDTAIDNLTVPLMLKPNGTRPWCIIAAYFTADGSAGGYPTVTLSGTVVSGTAPIGTVSRAASAARGDADGLEGQAR